MDSAYQVQVADANGSLVTLRLARDAKSGRPLWRAKVLDFIRPSVQVGEATYASTIPNVSGVYAQADLSGGIGKKAAVPASDADADRYYYGEWMDWSVAGQGQKGALVTTLTAPANSGTLSGYFELGGTPYLVLSRRVCSYSGGALTATADLGAGAIGQDPAVFVKLGSETATEDGSGATGGSDTLKSNDDLLAQSVRSNQATLQYIGRVDVKLQGTGTLTGDLRLRVMADLNGRPSGTALASATMNAVTVATGAAAVYSFRFDDDDAYAMAPGETFWLVLDLANGTTANYVTWTKSTSDVYTRGTASKSTDRGNSWTNDGSGYDLYFKVYSKALTETVFLADDSATNKYLTSTDGSTFTADSYRSSAHVCFVGDRIVRDIRAVGTRGAITASTDGTNWDEPIVVGDPTTSITRLLALGDVLLVCKTDGVWAVDITAAGAPSQPLLGSFPVSTNGVGACVWKGAAYIPFNGMLGAVSGDFDTGFTVYQSVGLESLPEWDWPWGAGRHVAVTGSRYHLYSLVSASDGNGYRLVKAAHPLRQKDDGSADPDWHGSLAAIGDGTQSVQTLAVYDPGGTSSPHLFCTTTSNNVADIILPRTFNPAADTAYRYDTAHTGHTYLPRAHGNFQVNPKAWLTDAVTFQRATGSDGVEVLYDTLDGDGWRRIGSAAQPLYDTGQWGYPAGLSSKLLARDLLLTTSATTTSPLLLAVGLTYAVRPSAGSPLRQFSFVVDAQDGLSAAELGAMLGIDEETIGDFMAGAAVAGGTRALVDHRGRAYPSVLFLDADETDEVVRDAGGAPGQIVIQAVQVG